jgi:signal recognition particle subunit SRP14
VSEKKQERLAMKDTTTTAEFPCLYRATKGSKKINTIVLADKMDKFHAHYSVLVRSKMDGLLKGERKRQKKKKKEEGDLLSGA